MGIENKLKLVEFLFFLSFLKMGLFHVTGVIIQKKKVYIHDKCETIEIRNALNVYEHVQRPACMMAVISALFDMAWNFVYTFLIFGAVKLRVAL